MIVEPMLHVVRRAMKLLQKKKKEFEVPKTTLLGKSRLEELMAMEPTTHGLLLPSNYAMLSKKDSFIHGNTIESKIQQLFESNFFPFSLKLCHPCSFASSTPHIPLHN